MKKGWLIVLLLSVGLNLGLGYRLWRGARQAAPSVSATPADEAHPRFAHGRRDSLWQRDRMEGRLRHMIRALDLRPDQIAAMRRVQRGNGEAIRRQGWAVGEMRRQLSSLLAHPGADSQQVRNLMHEMGRRQAGLDSLVTETIMREMEILDPAQREAYLRMLPLGRGRFGGPGRGPGPGPGQ